MNRNEWLCIGCLKIREEKDFRRAAAYRIRAFRNIEAGEVLQPMVYALCTRCKTGGVERTPKLFEKKADRLARNAPNPGIKIAVAIILGVNFLYAGDFWAAVRGGFSKEEILGLQEIWEGVDGYTILDANCSAGWTRN